MWKTCNVVLLSTNNICHTTYCLNSLELHTDDKISLNGIQQHLYITSDEEIKENDWYLNGLHLYQADRHYQKAENDKKIIATTDTSLNIKSFDKSQRVKLFQPHYEFIERYIEEYNKGNVITKVDVEYEVDYSIYCNQSVDNCNILRNNSIGCELCIKAYWKLKVNPDNTINIKPIKDNWNREEVRQLCYQAFIYHKCTDGKIKPSDAMDLIEPFKEWCIKNNL